MGEGYWKITQNITRGEGGRGLKWSKKINTYFLNAPNKLGSCLALFFVHVLQTLKHNNKNRKISKTKFGRIGSWMEICDFEIARLVCLQSTVFEASLKTSKKLQSQITVDTFQRL